MNAEESHDVQRFSLDGIEFPEEGRGAVDPAARDRVQTLLQTGGLRVVFQPLVELKTHRIIGYEALARFPDQGATSPAKWFSDAMAAGLRTELETVAIRVAVIAAAALRRDTFLALNVSPSTAIALDLRHELESIGLDRVIIEITELAAIVDYPKIEEAIEKLRHDGLRIALDDTGSGDVSLRHVVGVRPDVIKIDVDITRDVDSDIANQAVASALCSFAARMGALVVAEGVETEAERAMLQGLGVHAGQGYLFGRPEPAENLVR